MIHLRGKRILITGASSGIGRALAFELDRKEAILVLAARNAERLRATAELIAAIGAPRPAPLVVPCDVTSDHQVRRMVKTCTERLGGIDVLVNNAGTGVYGEILRTSLEDFRSVMEVNAFGALRCILESVPVMKRQGKGLVVNILSVAAIHGVPYLAAYSASKSALVAACQSLRAELAGDGISILDVLPNYTETDFFRNEKKVGGARRPLGPYAPPEAVARAIVAAIEAEKKTVVLSAEGKALKFFNSVVPRVVEGAMARIARRLREAQKVIP
jgi:short-subunit dehydrogenase